MTGVRTSLELQLLEWGKALFSGRVEVNTGGLTGTLELNEGVLVDARLGRTTGEPALWRMLLPERPTLTTEPGEPRVVAGDVLGPPDSLLARYEERYTLLARYADKVGGFNRVWALRFDALSAYLDDLPDAINPVLRLLDGKRTVREVVTECVLDDMLALRILGKLLRDGLLVLPEDDVAMLEATGDVSGGLEEALERSLAEQEAIDDERATLHERFAALDEESEVLLAVETTGAGPEALVTPIERPRVPRAVTMMPVPLQVTIAPPPATPTQRRAALREELRVWLGAEEAFFKAEPDPAKKTDDDDRLSRSQMVLLFLLAVTMGVVFATQTP